MTPVVFTAVLLAAAMHAGWNALVKVGQDRFLAITLIAGAGSLMTVGLLPVLAFPVAGAWPWLLTSVALHIGYNLFLVRAYSSGDLGQIYPVARGGAPLLVSLVSLVLLGETLSLFAMAGLVLLSGGIILMAFGGGRAVADVEPGMMVDEAARRSVPVFQHHALAYALGTSVFIAAYTVTDAIGSRINGSAHGYAAWLFFLDGVVMLAIAFARRGGTLLRMFRPVWRQGLAGGAMSLAAYWIVIWAMTRAPISLVAALRETSVLFGAVIAVVVLHERLTLWRAAAGVAILAGIVLVRTA